MPNLYDLTEDMMRLEDLIEDGDQEIDEEWLVSEWETLEGDINDKTEKWLKCIKNHEADIKVRKDAIADLTAKNERDQRTIDFMKRTLVQVMGLLGKKKAGTAILSCTVAANGGKAPLVWADGFKEDPTLLPEKWRTKVETWKPNTDEIRDALAAGEKIPGVELGERGTHLLIR